MEKQLQFMADAGIETCILSLSTPHIHFGDDALAAQIARDINSEVAEICLHILTS